MKKLVYTLFFVLISVVANGQAKYVFYFIGDGMGVNQVNGTEMYQAEIQNGRIGVEPLLFTQFLMKWQVLFLFLRIFELFIRRKDWNLAIRVFSAIMLL